MCSTQWQPREAVIFFDLFKWHNSYKSKIDGLFALRKANYPIVEVSPQTFLIIDAHDDT